MPTIIRKQVRPKPVKYHKLEYTNDYGKYYNSFRSKRNLYIQSHPLDELELLEGNTVPAEHVHHVIELIRGVSDSDKMYLTTDEDNFMSLSKSNHYRLHNKFNTFTDKQRNYINNKIKKLKLKYFQQNIQYV